MIKTPSRSQQFFGHIDRYMLKVLLPRMAAALGITLIALLIERILRLFDLVAGIGAELGSIFALAFSLVPHYLGLALPAAFCVGILGTLSALSKENEIDALESAGWSLRRIGAPFLFCALIMTLISLFLFGVVQPYSRYAFYEIRYAIKNAAWNGRVEQASFLDLGKGLTLSVDDVDATGRVLYNVFLLNDSDGDEVVITAKRGTVKPTADGKNLVLLLEDGQLLFPEGQVAKFDRYPIARRFDLDDNNFRERGESHRELTFFELWKRMNSTDGKEAEPRFATEFHGRLIRAFSLFGVAMIAVPLGVSRKRSPTWRRIVIAIALLAIYDNLIKFVSSVSTLGYINPALGLWGLCFLFTVFSLWLYITTPSQGSQSPVNSFLKQTNRLFTFLGQRRASILAGGEKTE